MKLAYKAYDCQGNAQAGTIESEDTAAAMDTLRRRGLFATEVAQQGQATSEVKKADRKLRLRLKIFRPGSGRTSQKVRNLSLFAKHIAVLLSSGTQLVDALSALERQAGQGAWGEVIAGLRSKIEEGASLSKAMEAYPEYFDSVCCSLTAAGEASGYLVEMLERLAKLKQRQLQIRNSVVGALVYPSLLVVVSLAVFSLMLVVVVPRFAALFDTLKVPLPGSTKVLVAISIVFRHYWWAVAFVLIAAIVAVVTYLRTPSGRRFRDTVVLRLPYMGKVVKSLVTARVIRLLGVLTQGHVPVLNALHLVKNTTGNVHYTELISKAEAHVVDGEPISLAFADESLIAPSVHEAIRSGEQSGQLDRLLLDIADFLDDENDVVVRSLTSIIEPVILVVMGVIVGVIAVSMFTPLFDLTAITGGGGE